MLELFHVTKRFGGKLLLNDIHVKIEKGTLYGIAGPDEEGMRALMRTISGISRPDLGKVLIDGEELYENEELKQKSFLMAENMFFRPRSVVRDSLAFYSGYEPNWEKETCERLMTVFGLSVNKRYYTLTPEEKALLRFAIAFSTRSEYLFIEQPFLNLKGKAAGQIRVMMQSYVHDRNAIIVTTAPRLREEEVDRYAYMVERKLLDGVTEQEYRETEKKLREEGAEHELEHFFK